MSLPLWYRRLLASKPSAPGHRRPAQWSGLGAYLLAWAAVLLICAGMVALTLALTVPRAVILALQAAARQRHPKKSLVNPRRRHFPRGVPALRAMIGGPFGALPHGNQREQAPQAIPVHDLQVPITIADKETLVNRLDHVFGIHPLPQPGVQVPEGEGDELVGEAR
jgi:hypothetical protein